MLEMRDIEFQLGRLRMRIQKNAGAISHWLCVALALFSFSAAASAGAGADIRHSDDRSGFVIGSGISSGIATLDDTDAIWPAEGSDFGTGAAGTMQFGAAGFTLAPVGSSGDVRWELFRSAEWDMAEDVAEIPEPAPLAILGIAILGLGFYRRYRTA